MPSSDSSRSSVSGTSLSLLVRAQQQEPAAWERLVELYGPLVYYWCKRAGLGPEDTADVFQDVFRSVAEHLPGFRRERAADTFRGWLRTIARNKINDLFRRREGQPRAAGGTDAHLRLNAVADINVEDDPSELKLIHQQVHRMLDTIRGDFEERTWQAFWLVQMEGKDTASVGQSLGMTQAAVRKAKLRVLQRLRQELGELL